MRGFDPRPYCAIPYAWDGAQCWDLVREVYQRELGIELPAYRERLDRAERAAIARLVAEVRAGPEWRRVDDVRPETFDVVVFHGGCLGVGVLVWRCEILLTSPLVGESMTLRFPQTVLGPIEGRYRHREVECRARA